MRIITYKKCGAKISEDFSNCTNSGNALSTKLERGTYSETRQGALVGGLVGLLFGIVAAVESYFITFPVIMPLMTKQLASEPSFASNPQFLLTLVCGPDEYGIVNDTKLGRTT